MNKTSTIKCAYCDQRTPFEMGNERDMYTQCDSCHEMLVLLQFADGTILVTKYFMEDQ